MLILNFTHPLTPDQRAQIEALANTSIDEIRTIPVQINQAKPLEPQITTIVDAVGLSSEEWQTRSLLIAPYSSTSQATHQQPSSYSPNSTDASATSLQCCAYGQYVRSQSIVS